ncbi:MAG: hypothetical protein ACREM3_23085, partial [Candidatus Rokuibacteriota bacterium]
MSYRRSRGRVRRPWASGAPDEGSAQTAAEYADLARARRKDDFQWFARSQGMTPPMIEQLWRELRADSITSSALASSWRPRAARAAVRRGRAGAA